MIERVMDLKPCPFCGGKAEYTDSDDLAREAVECHDCSATTHGSSAVENWNHRAEIAFKPKEWIEVFRELEALRYEILPEYQEAVASLHQKEGLPPETPAARFIELDTAFKALLQKLSVR